MQIFQNLDANESIFFARELEYIKKKTYDIRYPVYKAKSMIPVSGEAGSGAESITYQSFDRVGFMKIIANYADDLPRSDVKGVEYTTPVKSLGGSYGYSIQEIRSASMAGKPLQARKASATRESWEQKVNQIGWFADGTQAYGGMRGILYQPNTTKAAATNGAWIATADADKTIADVNIAINAQRSLTKGVEEPDTVLLPVDEFGWIASTPRATVSDTTILEFLRRVNPGITFDWVNELGDVDPKPSGGAGPVNCMLIYRKSPDKLTFEIPQEYEQFAPQLRGLEYVVPAHGRTAGVVVYYPLSISVIEGI
jgi:hypothetical protein